MHLELDWELPCYKHCTHCPRDEAPDNNIPSLIAFMTKSLISAEEIYSSIEREALGILYKLEKFHHY